MKPHPYVMLFSLAVCWGPSYLFIKLAGTDFGPFMISASRVIIGSMILFTICLLQKRKLLPYISYWKHFLFMGIFLNALPFTLINYGEKYISSGLTAILIATTPIFTSIGAHFYVEKERISFIKFSGILFAFFGVVVIYFPYLFDNVPNNALGSLLVLLASLCYSFSTIYAKRYLSHLPPLIGPVYQMIMASIILLPFALTLNFPDSHSTSSVSGLLAIGIFGTAFGFFVYYELIRMKGPSFASLNALIAPVVAVFLGWIFLSESLKWNAFLGGALILIGLLFSNNYIWHQSHK